MDKQKYLNTLHNKQIIKKRLFKPVFLIIDNKNINIEVCKINHINDYYNYIQPLLNFPSNQGFLLKNIFYFNLQNFVLNVDVILIDNYFNVVKCLQNIKKMNVIDGTDLKAYNILFLEENSINFFDIKVGQKVRLSKFNS